MISKKKEMMQAFKDLGWKTGRDEVGDATCLYSVDGVDLHAMPGLKKLPNRIIFDAYASVSTMPFSKVESEIYGEKSTHVPIIVSKYREFVIEKPEITLEDVRTLSDKMIAWAKAQDIELGLKKYRELPTDAKGIFPLHHLAALALAGDKTRLQYYQACFAQGNRLDFVPYITKDMIDRAVLICDNPDLT